MLRDVLLEAGPHEAGRRADDRSSPSSLVEGLDGEAAARVLQEALSLDPENARREPRCSASSATSSSRSPSASGDRAATRGRRRRDTTHRPALRPRGAAPVVRPRRDRPGGRRAPLVLRAEHPRDGRRAGGAAQAAARSVDDIDDPFAEARCRASRSTAAPESEAAFELTSGRGRRRPTRREPELRRAAAPGVDPDRHAGARVGARRGRVLRFARSLRRRAHHPPRAARAPAEPPAPARAPDRARRAGARDAGRLGHAPVARGRRLRGWRTARSTSRSRSGATTAIARAASDPADRRCRRRAGRRRRGVREVQGGRRRADRRRRRAEPLRPRRRLQGDGPRRRRAPRVRGRRRATRSARASASR